MKVILQKAVPKVGKAGEIVEVSDGYATNALFPHKLAILATEKNIAALQRKHASAVAEKALQHELLERAIATLPNEALTISMRANEKGHLFSRLTEDDIVTALLTHRVSIAPKNIFIHAPIRALGEYIVVLHEGSYRKEILVRVVAQ